MNGRRRCAYLTLATAFDMNRYESRPELWLPPCYPINKYIRRLPQSQRNRAAVLVRVPPILIVPLLAVAKEESFAVATHGEIRPAQSPRGRSLRIRDANAVSEPVLNVIIPGKLPFD